MSTQHIRRSQFIFTYGPGSIIEGENGSRLMPSLKNGMNKFFNINNLENFEINDIRMSNILEKTNPGLKPRIFALPSNASLNLPEYFSIYGTYIFPMWRICYSKKHHYPVLYRGKACPVCKDENSANVRFVSACPEGHLDEVNWNYAVHNGQECNTYYYYWKARGSSLSDIIIECANSECGCSTNLEEVYKTSFICSGRTPENENSDDYYRNPQRKSGCKGKMKVIQRQSTALRIPETMTLLTIPQYDSDTLRILQRSDVRGPIKMATSLCKHPDDFMEHIKYSELPEYIIRTFKSLIDDRGYENFVKFINDLYEMKIDVKNVVDEEFNSLKGPATRTKNFHKKEPLFYNFPIYDNFKLDVYPVEKLRTVTVQVGYRRMPYMKKEGDSKIIPSGEKLDHDIWLPGFEGIGEGIFITSKQNPLENIGPEIIEKWETRKKQKDDNIWKGSIISWRNGLVKDPQFVWWHTLSHALIRTLSLVCGYSSAALRERVYVDQSLDSGGILIYTSSSGEDGGMGGLVETAANFEPIIQKAIESVALCSNDPLCSEMKITNESVNGSACHNCLMASETSCEHGNKWLDRNIMQI